MKCTLFKVRFRFTPRCTTQIPPESGCSFHIDRPFSLATTNQITVKDSSTIPLHSIVSLPTRRPSPGFAACTAVVAASLSVRWVVPVLLPNSHGNGRNGNNSATIRDAPSTRMHRSWVPTSAESVSIHSVEWLNSIFQQKTY